MHYVLIGIIALLWIVAAAIWLLDDSSVRFAVNSALDDGRDSWHDEDEQRTARAA